MATRATLESRLVTKQAQLVIANETYTTLLGKINKEYLFDSSSNGEQSAKKQSLKDIKNQIKDLEAEIESLELKLGGGGVMRLHVSRYP